MGEGGETNTKERLLEEASRLFSQFGYNGTSVRQLAEKSGVNIAAVTYHFGGKPGLYIAVIAQAEKWIEDGVIEVTQKSKDLEEVTRRLFQFMRSGEDFVRATMKTILSEGVPSLTAEAEKQGMSTKHMGPPGSEYLFAFIRKHHGEDLDSRAVQWAVQGIMSSLFHWATMCSCSIFKDKVKSQLSELQIEENLVHMTKATLAYMSDKKNSFPESLEI